MEIIFVSIGTSPYLGPTIDTAMKQIFLLIAAALVLASCSKESVEKTGNPEQPMGFFSKVQYFKDNRTPAVDTVWTLRLETPEMVQRYTELNGYVYWESSVVKEVGVLHN